MSSSKEIILNQIRRALKDVPEGEREEQMPVGRSYRQAGTLKGPALTTRFTERVGEYRADVTRIKEADIPRMVMEICRAQEVRRLVIPAGLPAGYLPDASAGLEYLKDGDTPLSHQELDESDGVITSCRLAVAQTGTIVLDGGDGQGRRALTLLPDFHLCIVFSGQIVGIVPEAFSKLKNKLVEKGAPVTMISGPSATSDIELDRVEGVHGPRRLHVLIVEE